MKKKRPCQRYFILREKGGREELVAGLSRIAKGKWGGKKERKDLDLPRVEMGGKRDKPRLYPLRRIRKGFEEKKRGRSESTLFAGKKRKGEEGSVSSSEGNRQPRKRTMFFLQDGMQTKGEAAADTITSW